MTVYIDIIFLENLFMNYIIIFATAIIIKSEVKISKILISSCFGAIYAIILYIQKMEIFSNAILKILLSVVMVEIAFKPSTFKSFLRSIIIFYLTSFTFGGVTFALLYFINPNYISFENGVIVGISSIKMILFGGMIGFIIIITAFKNIKGKLSKKDMFCDLTIEINKKNVSIKAIIDTGNFLRDPITNLPVIIVEKDVMEKIIDKDILNNLEKIVLENTEIPNEILGKIRVIPFKSLGTKSGLLVGLKSETIKVFYQEEEITLNNITVGIYNGKLYKTGKYSGLIGMEVINNGKQERKFIRNF